MAVRYQCELCDKVLERWQASTELYTLMSSDELPHKDQHFCRNCGSKLKSVLKEAGISVEWRTIADGDLT